MKILYLNTLYSPLIEGGAEISLKLIVEGMKSRGYAVAVLSLKPGEGLEEDWVDGVKVYRGGLKNIYWPYTDERPRTLKRLAWHLKDSYNRDMRAYVKEVIDREQPDVVSCHNLAGWSAAVWDEIGQANIPIVQVLHDMYLACANSNMFKGELPCSTQCLSCRFLRAKHPDKSNQVAAVVGISQSILGRFTAIDYFKFSKKFVIHNTRSIPVPERVRRREKGSPFKIGYLGTLSKIKGLEWLIAQFQKLDIDASLIIAGRGKEDYEEKLKAMAVDPRISFLGYVKPTQFFPLVDILVVPSLWEEPLGMVAIEALANHVPVIANKSGGLKESVIAEVNGLFCEAAFPDTLGKAMERLYRDVTLYNRLAGAARESIAAILSEDRMISEYKAVIDMFQPTQATHPST